MIHRWENLFLECPVKIWSQFFFRIFLIFNLSSHKLLPVRSLFSGHYGNPSVNIAFTVGGVTCCIVKLTYEIIIINIVDIGIIGFLQFNPAQKIMSGQIKNVSLFFESVHFKFIFAKFLKNFFYPYINLQSSDCRYRHTHDNERDYSFRVWTQVSPRLTAVCPNCQTSTAAKSLLR